MIITQKKPIEEVLAMVANAKTVALVGCNSCATACQTGGQKNGKCEVDPENPCAWIEIYKRLQATGEVEKITQVRDAKGYGKFAYPRTISLKGKK